MKNIKKQNHIKYREQVDFYNNYEGEKCLYTTFSIRIKIQGLSFEEAIVPHSLIKHETKTKADENGRICVRCLEYKDWSCFAKFKGGHNLKTSDCKECRNKIKREYRKRTGGRIDKEYRKRRRTLDVGEIICLKKPRVIDGVPREDRYEVIKYVFKKGYMLRSAIDGTYTWIDTNDNPNRKNFYRLNEKNDSTMKA